MAVITAAIDPVTRLEGHLKVEVDIDTVNGVQQVVDARSIGTLFRGFEKVLEGRDPRDAPLITSRICGVCPTAHSMAAVLLLDAAFGVSGLPENARLLRNLVHGACFVESDILHFYLLSLPDFIRGPGMAPWQPGWEFGKRLDRRSEDRLLAHYLEAVDYRRKAHEMGAVYGGRLPHTPGFIAGGFTAVSTEADRTKFRTLLTAITEWIQRVYIPDVELLASIYSDHYALGRGYGNLLSYGVFEETGADKLLRPGVVWNGVSGVQPLDPARIAEHIRFSWYTDTVASRHPATGETNAQYPKDEGYSWLKAPRYDGLNMELGPLSRMTVNGDYKNGVSVMDRHLARARECLKIAQAMDRWLTDLAMGTTAFAPYTIPMGVTSAAGLTEAPRGALGHWMEIANQKIARYQVVTPTCWNCSPRDSAGALGPMEKALIGVPVARADQPVEVLRVIHSFDPCLDCATHVMRPGEKARVIPIWTPPVAT